MLVSTCRVDLQADVRRGYTLHLTNLEDTRLDYLVTFVVTVRIPLMSSGPATGEVERFARFTGDGFSVEQPFRPSAVGKASPFDGATYTAGVRLRVGARRTGTIAIEPPVSFGFGLMGARTPSLTRLEGYVTLRLPPARTNTRRFFMQPQADRPVRVLLNPETRTINLAIGQRMDIYNDEPPVQGSLASLWGGIDVANSYDPPPVKRGFALLPSRTTERTEPLHLASGKAENELEPEGSRLITAEGLEYAIASLPADGVDASEYRGAELVADQDRAGALIELLCELDNDPALAGAINQVLEKQQAAIRIVARRT